MFNIVRTFIFENEATSQSVAIPMSFPQYIMWNQMVQIQQTINNFKQMNSISEDLLLKVYNPFTDSYNDFDPDCGLNRVYLMASIILIKYRVDVPMPLEVTDEEGESTPQHQKKQRNKQRTIRQVLFYVKKWRQTHNTFTKTHTKINLQQAAKIVGIAKKSLDDYYSQLRLAEKYGFDFQKHIDKKIGILRMFVKNHKQKEHFTKYDKLPKKLKIIEEYEYQPGCVKSQNNQEIEQTIVQSNSLLIKVCTQSQKQFYKSFNFMLDDPQNPFVRKNPKGPKALQQQQFLLF